MTGSVTVNWLRQQEKWVYSRGVNSSPQANVLSFEEMTGCNGKALKFFLAILTTVVSLTRLVT